MASLIGLVLLLAFVGPAAAQEQQPPDETRYIVQPGDTLSTIAARWEIGLDVIIQANGITDPNSLSVGTELILPGVTWVTGTLDAVPVTFGETFRSLSRRYKLLPLTLAHLGGVVSPAQMFVGYPLLVATNRGELLNAARVVVGDELSLLTTAVTAGSNPWALTQGNLLAGTWAAVPGDVLFVPGTEQTGPGALPSPITQIEVGGGGLMQGKTVVLRVNANGLPLQLSGELVGMPLNFFPDGAGGYVALQGVHVMLLPGLYPLTISGQMADGSSFSFTQMAIIREGSYGHETITVEDDYLNAEVSALESAYIDRFVSQVSPDKLWADYFGTPTIYSDTVNSYFGTRRSFNKSPFDYFHAGIDFGGGTGVEIRSPAAGVVVMAEPLDIRGNATIIDHGQGVFTGYWHQSEQNVQVGDRVEIGQLIGLVGNTGRSSGAHLHWEVWVGGIQVEPLDWLYNIFP